MNINGKWYTEPQIEAYVTELENKVVELEAKHWNECGQIAHYSDELRKAKRLLMIAVEHFRQIGTNAEYDDERGYGCVLTDEHACGEGVCPLDSGDECKWRHEAEALALIGEDTNVPASADGTNVGHKSGGWISCEDRMPEVNEPVLFIFNTESGFKTVMYGWHETIKGLGSGWHQAGVGGARADEEVTHWQPLPEPPVND